MLDETLVLYRSVQESHEDSLLAREVLSKRLSGIHLMLFARGISIKAGDLGIFESIGPLGSYHTSVGQPDKFLERVLLVR